MKALIEPSTEPCRKDAAANAAAFALASTMACPAASASACAWVDARQRRGRIGLRDLEIDGGLVGQLGLEFHVVLQALDVALGLGHQPGEPADLGGRGRRLLLAVLDLLVRRVVRRRRHRSGRHRDADDQGDREQPADRGGERGGRAAVRSGTAAGRGVGARPGTDGC